MPIIGKPLLVLGSLAGVSLLGTGGYFGISHLVSLNSQQPAESNPPTPEDAPANGESKDKHVTVDEGGAERVTDSEDTQTATASPENPPSAPLKDTSSDTGVERVDATEDAAKVTLPESGVEGAGRPDQSLASVNDQQSAIAGGETSTGVTGAGRDDALGEQQTETLEGDPKQLTDPSPSPTSAPKVSETHQEDNPKSVASGTKGEPKSSDSVNPASDTLQAEGAGQESSNSTGNLTSEGTKTPTVTEESQTQSTQEQRDSQGISSGSEGSISEPTPDKQPSPGTGGSDGSSAEEGKATVSSTPANGDISEVGAESSGSHNAGVSGDTSS